MSLTTPRETLRNGIATTTGIEPLVLDVSPIEAGELAERVNAEPGWVG